MSSVPDHLFKNYEKGVDAEKRCYSIVVVIQIGEGEKLIEFLWILQLLVRHYSAIRGKAT
tara:strand:+ start:396 stop:575 length:180 start_codon:yes stop_codon:yes gene_type:complete